MSVIILLAGDIGTGKTAQGMKYLDGYGMRKVLIDLEHKAQATFDAQKREGHLEDDVDIKPVRIFTPSFKVDHKATFAEVFKVQNEIITSDLYDVIIIDSVTCLRNSICSDFFCAETGNKTVGERNYVYVNEFVRQFVEPLVMYCKCRHRVLIMISHMKDIYQTISKEEKVVIGSEPAIHKELAHLADVVVELKGDAENRYSAVCTRSPVGKWTEDISDNKSLSDLFATRMII